ncbi:rubrerythrin-like domain-containing protein [Halohasta salina]|uniref:rubrerythrin-like domain-containing protein n=1 Tax=Halohasta salina TaxID=2961621 RepID=UPI0020A4CB1E|nr:rubrerythrin-like domain-containing protein [Halohasta salina]
MVPHNATIDPFTPSTNYFECVGCGSRCHSDERLTTCPDCGDRVRNIAVPRE